MAWIGSIGGLLGIISFTDTYIGKMIDAFKGPPPGPPPPPVKHDTKWFKDFEAYHRKILSTKWKERVAPKKKGDPSWKVGLQVGLDGSGLRVNDSRFCPTLKFNLTTEINASDSAVRKRVNMNQHLTDFLTITRELGVNFPKSACGTFMAS